MKKKLFFYFSILALLIISYQTLNADHALHVFEKGNNKPELHIYDEIDSITTELNGSVAQQHFYTKDSLYIYNMPDIDSIVFNVPFIKYLYLDIDEIHIPKISFNSSLELHHSREYKKNVFAVSESNWFSASRCAGSQNYTLFNISGNTNDTNEDRTAYLCISTENGVDTIKVTQYNKDAFIGDLHWLNNRWVETTHTWQKRIHKITINEPFLFSGLEYYKPGYFFTECDWINYTISKDKRTLTLEVDENSSDTSRQVKIYPCFYPNIRADYSIDFQQHRTGVATPEMQKEALIDLYNTMGGINWGNNENWLSDRPLREWAGLEVGLSEDVKTLNITGASGEFPASLAKIMDVADRIRISGTWDFWTQTHGLQGVKIPKEITQHPRWNEYIGWEILLANRPCGKGIDMDGINLRMKDETVMFPDSTTSTAYEVLSRNKYSLISVGMPTDEMANVFLSYRNKGFGYIHAAQDWFGGTIEELRETAKNYPLDIIYTYDSFNKGGLSHGGGYGFNQLGSTFILDSIGNVIDFEGHDWDMPDSYYANRIDSILHNLLGEPEPHDPFVTTYYTSTDYSKDGEVLTLQKATVGKGIDLVFMGDAYDDRDMAEGGLYETDMRKSMEYFFEVEPYKSFRNRFNVYAVKVVSPNSHIGDGCTQAINYSDEVCFNYASKIEGIDLNKVTIVNIINHIDYFRSSGYTNMYESGASVAHIEQGGPSSIIVHEAGGHGFAKLLDEYIYSGYEDNYCPPENLESFKQWIKTEYHDRGWGMNIDTTNDPDSVVWSHFLKDTRYTGEVGIYQGAWYWPTDLWRASENSVMNSDYSTFNAPSREVIYKRIMQLSEGDDWVYDYETFIKWDKKNRSSNIVIDGISYKIIDNDKVKIVGNDGSLSGEVVVKSSITDYDGTTYNVTEIGTRAFADCPDLTVLDIHENIELFEEGYLEGNQQDLTIIMRSTNPPQFADPYYGFYKGYWTLKIPMSAYDLYEAKGWTGELQVVDINEEQSTTKMKTALVRPMVDNKPTVRQIKNHRIPKIIKGSPLNPQGEVAIPDFFNKTK